MYVHGGNEEAAQEVGNNGGGDDKDAEALLAEVLGVEHDGDAVGGVHNLKEQGVDNEANNDAQDLAVGLHKVLGEAAEINKEHQGVHKGLQPHHETEPVKSGGGGAVKGQRGA